MKYYAIRHKPTGFFLPNYSSTHRAGATFVKPRDPIYFTPRLYMTKQHAATSLSWWLDGTYHREPRMAHEWDDSYVLVKTLQPDRKAEDMEIVEITLTVSNV